MSFPGRGEAVVEGGGIEMIRGLLDQDVYKFSTQQAVLQLYPRALAEYKLINRGSHLFSGRVMEDLQMWVNGMEGMILPAAEAKWMLNNLPFLTPAYIDFLRGYRFNASEVKINGSDITVTGHWYSVVLWEVVLMAMLSELYFKDSNVDISEFDEVDRDKGLGLREAAVKFADFGTRRRFSSDNHARVVRNLIGSAGKFFVGTSNVLLAMECGLKPIGTMAHEWFMFHTAKYGFRYANEIALQKWVEVFHGALGIALSDTFMTDVFLRSLGMHYAKLFDGVRQDSGDPIVFAGKIIAHYKSLGIDPHEKTIVFSDGLDVDKVKIVNVKRIPEKR